MKGGFEYLEDTKKISKEKFLDLDIKIPEIFVLATSVVMIFLSTVAANDRGFFYWVSLLSFAVVLVLSIIILFINKKLHKSTWNIASGALNDMSNLLSKAKTESMDMPVFIKKMDDITKNYRGFSSEEIVMGRKWIDILLICLFIIFMIGIICLFLLKIEFNF